ncbi:hypothetical protein HPB50_022454 [Hyalomma asiaticum]|uniref:Uncharacterized protein n=1 Tax=Hyalomma asiaticum TaxID=266040 RepID=A0ACB7TLI0_HYAAI|nr:hypothetical protein HPB50_022454 [Hyalomma asiaticum]
MRQGYLCALAPLPRHFACHVDTYGTALGVTEPHGFFSRTLTRPPALGADILTGGQNKQHRQGGGLTAAHEPAFAKEEALTRFARRTGGSNNARGVSLERRECRTTQPTQPRFDITFGNNLAPPGGGGQAPSMHTQTDGNQHSPGARTAQATKNRLAAAGVVHGLTCPASHASLGATTKASKKHGHDFWEARRRSPA